MNIQLNPEQARELELWLDTESYSVLIKVVLPQLLEGQKNYVVTTNDADLVKERARYEGMLKLNRDLNGLKEYLLGKNSKPR